MEDVSSASAGQVVPTGTVTFLFTDIEGSTKLAQQNPEAMPDLLARHHEILHQSISAHNGYVFQIVGDSFCAAFSSAVDAVNAAIEAQKYLYNEAWSPAPIRVRMGIHTGTAQLNEGNQYSGYATLASCQRIMSAGHGGQVLLSTVTRELVRDALPVHAELVDLGEKRLKDLMRPEHLYQLNLAGLPVVFPPLKTLDLYPNNLPVHLTSFIGRENEIAAVRQELESHRLITLTGSGGTGKTRLSLQVAADLLEKFDHGVWFVELAPLTDPELIPQAILSAIGLREQPGRLALEILQEYLYGKKTLILLDNCEHLISASAQVANTLLRAAPTLKILASSREALGVKGEVSYHVPSLKLPDPKHPLVLEQLSQYEAVRLFIDRALLVAPHFAVDNDNAPFIAQICYRLDGIPLAIELAAARMRMLSVEQISRRLDDRFRLLTGGARTALPRQQTLRALIDWSYDLLSDDERLLLRRLSVFAGGWTLEAAEEVCSGDDIKVYNVLDLLSQLVNKSLVVVIEHSQRSETRYRILETIRQYAREKLLESGGSESLRDQHLAYFVKLVEQAEPELFRSKQLFWLNRLEDELDNMRLALEWAVASNVRAGLKIASIPWRFWGLRGTAREWSDWLKRLLELDTTLDALHAQALVNYSFSRFTLGEIQEAPRLAEQSLQLSRALSDKRMEAFSLSFLGGINILQGKVGTGFPLLEESLAIYQSLADKIGQVNTLGLLTTNSGNFERTNRMAGEFLRLSREVGDLASIATGLIRLSRFAIWRGDFASPAPRLDEALTLARQMDDRVNEEEALTTYGVLCYWLGEYQRAISFYEEAIELGEQVGNVYQNLWAQFHMSYVFLRQGDIQRARERFLASIADTHKANFLIALVYNIEGLASLHVHENQLARAVQLFAWADVMREKIGDHRPPVEQASVDRDLAVLRSQLDDSTFERLWREGGRLTQDQAIMLALNNTQ
jgi:predicted ATPase/class 3 adenylate cyclase/tetratricopeptide (TPR) repeat protein